MPLTSGLIAGLRSALRPGLGGSSADITHQTGWSGGSTADGLSFVTASIDVPAGSWLVVGVTNTGAAAQDPSTVAGAGLSLSLQGSAFTVGTLNNCRCSVWAARAAANFSGTLTITFAGTATACCWAPLVLRGGGADAIAQVSAGATGTGTNLVAAALAAFASPDNVNVTFNVSRGSDAILASETFTKYGEGSAISPTLRIESQACINDTTSTASVATSAEWGAISLEFKSA